ncbi:hypothetical protein [Paenibacillus sp. S02]|uniref:hypothetical protein n=1 Tax=Paenibacillus sp. S02 TaxID=2823904 RepID=UPI001C646CE0|nr:hypothetical protein [Paenibacillus sp. S02]QYK68291.1 hypothetical protein KAI36_03442 [Paenibacillus sp. S02]
MSKHISEKEALMLAKSDFNKALKDGLSNLQVDMIIGMAEKYMLECEQLREQADESGMVTALLEADLLATKKELAERDRTIAQLQEMDRLHTSGAKQLVQDLRTLRVDRDKLQEALDQVQQQIAEKDQKITWLTNELGE